MYWSLRYWSFVNDAFLSFCGVVLVSLSDGSSDTVPEHALKPAWGDFLALLSAFFYALYVTLLKVRIRDESRIDMQLFFGFVGLFNVITLWPIAIILHLTGAETFQLPSGRRMIAGILMNVCLTYSCLHPPPTHASPPDVHHALE
jgi:solute carrier family 35, member F5